MTIDKLYKRPKKEHNSEGDEALLKEARERSRQGQTYWKENYDNAESDLNFIAGDQWPEGVRNERELDGRPCLTNNVLPAFVDQVLGDLRQNRPTIKVSPTEPAGMPTITSIDGASDYDLAETFTALIKNIEYQCDAETAYDMAAQQQVQSGIGWLRAYTKYQDEGFEQEIVIKNIEDQFSVTIDPNAKEFDYSDAMWCLVDEVMPKTKFKELYPDKNADPVNGGDAELSTWYAENTVRVSEYFTREAVVKELALLSDGRTYYLEELEPIVDELLEQGISIVRTRKCNAYKVVWRKISGTEVLEGPTEMPCSTIPVVPVWGKSVNIKRKKIFQSLIRHAKDSQRMLNYWDTAATESVALAPKAPFVGTEGHTEGYEDDWRNANTENKALLTYVPQFQGDPGPQRAQPAMVPAAELSMSAQATDKIKSTLGMFDASIGAMGNETSGKAIIARQRQGDRGTYAFPDNLTKSIRRIGKLVVEMLLKTCDSERIMRLKFEDDTEDFVKLNEQILDDESGQYVTIHDLNIAKYDVVVTTGPSYATQRMEAADAMIQFAQAVPNAAGVMGDLIATNMDWPGAETIAKRLKRIVPPEVLSASEREDMAEDAPEPPPPSPADEVAMAEIEANMKEAEAKMAKAETDLVKAQLESEEAKAAMAQINAGADANKPGFEEVQEMIAQGIAEVIQQGVNLGQQ